MLRSLLAKSTPATVYYNGGEQCTRQARLNPIIHPLHLQRRQATIQRFIALKAASSNSRVLSCQHDLAVAIERCHHLCLVERLVGLNRRSRHLSQMHPVAAVIQRRSVGHQSSPGCRHNQAAGCSCSLGLQEENREEQLRCFHNMAERRERQYTGQGHVRAEGLQQPIQSHDMDSALGDGDGER